MFMFMQVTSEEIHQELCGILSSLASPTLETFRLELDIYEIVAVSSESGLEMLQDITADSDRTGYDELHAALARTVFDRLAHATIMLNSRCWVPQDRALAKKKVTGIQVLLHTLFAPWFAGGILRLVGGIHGARYAGVVTENGEDRNARDRLLADSVVHFKPSLTIPRLSSDSPRTSECR